MALGNISGWAQHDAQREEQFSYAYWTSKASDVRNNMGMIDSTNKTLAGPEHRLLPASEMWNEYLKVAQSRGIKPNYAAFKENYDKLVQQDNTQFMNLFTSAMAQGLDTDDIRESINANPEMKQRLTKLMMQSDPETQATLAPFLKEEQSFWDMVEESPLMFGGGALATGYAAKKFGPSLLNKLKPGGLGTTAGLAASGQLVEMALENFGVDKSTADKIGAATQIGLGGYVGKDFLTKEGRAKLFGQTKGEPAVAEKSGLSKRQQTKLDRNKAKLKTAREKVALAKKQYKGFKDAGFSKPGQMPIWGNLNYEGAQNASKRIEAAQREVNKIKKSIKYYEDLEKKKFRPGRPAVPPKTKPPGFKGVGRGAMALLPMAMGLYDWFNEE